MDKFSMLPFFFTFFTLNVHGSKEKGLYDEEDRDRCSFKISGCHNIFSNRSFLIMTILTNVCLQRFKGNLGLSLDQNLDSLNLCLPTKTKHVIGKNISE